MITNHLLDNDDPILKAAPSLKQAILPKLEGLKEEHALASCFEMLCFLDKNPTKPFISLPSPTIEEHVELLAKSCGYSAREINIQKIPFSQYEWPCLAFDGVTGTAKLIFYKNSNTYLFDPLERTSQLLNNHILGTLHPVGFILYKQIKTTNPNVKDLAKAAYGETKSDLNRYILLQGILAIITLFQPILSGMIFDDVLELRQISFMHQIFLGILIMTLTSTLFQYVQMRALTRLQLKSARFMQSAIWQRLLSFHLGFFRIFRLGDIHERASTIDTVQRELTSTTINGLCQGFFSILTLGLITYYVPTLGAIVFIATVAFFAISFFLMMRMVHHHRSVIHTNARLISFLFEAIRSVVKIKTTNSKDRVFTRWLNLELSKMSPFMKEQSLLIYHHLMQFAFPPLMMIALYLLVKDTSSFHQTQAATASTSLSLGKLMSVQFALAQYFAAFMGMISVMDQLLRLVPLIERIRPLLEQPLENEEGKRIPRLKGSITLSHLNFRYRPEEPLVLKDINLSISSGEYIAIVGPSGAGKSTLLKILLGFDQIDEGTIVFDNIPSSQINMSEIRRQIGVVMQQTALLPGSILDNIRAVNPHMREETIWLLLSFVGLKKDIEAMPMGLHTLILGDGRSFSMGQRQRLALARCMAKKCKILLLDEPTGSLDNQSQEIVLKTLKHYPATRIMIAHRLSTLKYVDRIIVMNKGTIVEDGTFSSLMASKGFFYHLVKGMQ